MNNLDSLRLDKAILETKLSKIVRNFDFNSGSLFNGAMFIDPGFISKNEKVYPINLPIKRTGFWVPERLMFILSAKDLYGLPSFGKNTGESNPVSKGMRKFCEVYKNSDQSDFEEYGREVLLEGLKSRVFSMVPDSDKFGIYSLLEENDVFMELVGKKGLKQVGLFLRSYGRLPYPNEDLKNPKIMRLFREKLNVPIGVSFDLPEGLGKITVVSITNRIIERQSIYLDERNFQIFSNRPNDWAHNISFKDVIKCIESGMNESLLTHISRLDPKGFSGKMIKVFNDVFEKNFPGTYKINYHVNDFEGIKILRISADQRPSGPVKFYAKGFMPFLLATGRFPNLKEIKTMKNEKSMNMERSF